MTYLNRADVLGELRDQISDATAVRWSNTSLYRYLLDGEREIISRHPESQYVDRVENVDPVLLTDASTDLTISDQWTTALVHYAAYRTFGEDSDDVANMNLAAFHKNQFEIAMGGGK